MSLSPKLNAETRERAVRACSIALLTASFFYTNSAYAVIPDLQTMLISFAEALPNLMRLVTAASYVMGMFFIIGAVMSMKHLGEMRTMQSREHGAMGPLIELLVGAALLYLPSSVQSGLSTFWQTTNPYAYQTTSNDQYTTFVNACYGIIQLVGTIAFIRGLVILKEAGGERARGGEIGKALTHLIGGILCINIYNAIKLFQATLGWT